MESVSIFLLSSFTEYPIFFFYLHFDVIASNFCLLIPYPSHFFSVDQGVSVSSVRSNMQQLSLKEDVRALSEEDQPSVIIPSHLQIQNADCSHLSFGSFGSGISGACPGPFSSRLKSNRDEASGDVDTPAVEHLDTRYSLR